MKAKDYYEKYKERLCRDEEDAKKGACDLVMEMLGECQEIVRVRKISNDKSFVSVLKEQNDKYNAISNLFEKEFGASPLIRNGFLAFCKDIIPIIRDAL